MIFDKTKAMRNAEKFLSQGKIRSAISEYQQVVAHDPKDFGTLNMLGDMHIKNSEKDQAVKCYTAVAEHYSKQGFAQKAIAVYNKIGRIEPNSIDVCIQLADLYRQKGSLSEARAHYTTLAEYYKKKGQTLDALAVWKQIAQLDPNNTEVYLSLGESFHQERQTDEAAEAFAAAGERFAKLDRVDDAIKAFNRALEVKPGSLRAVEGLVKGKIAKGESGEAVDLLNDALAEEPNNRELLFLVIDTLSTVGKLSEAESHVIKLVEIEPANYPKFLELSHAFLADGDMDGAARMLAMSSEHLLVGGQSEEFRSMLDQILAVDASQLEALRLNARFYLWQKDEDALKNSLEKLADAAARADSVVDERYALSQLTMIAPHEMQFAERLRDINAIYGYDEQENEDKDLFDQQFLKKTPVDINGEVRPLSGVSEWPGISEFEIAEIDSDAVLAAEAAMIESFEAEVIDDSSEARGFGDVEPASDLPPAEELRLHKEIDSIMFYIESGYLELAEKAVGELRGDFGDRPEISALHQSIRLAPKPENASLDDDVQPSVAAATNGFAVGESIAEGFDLADIRNQFGLDEPDAVDDADYDTHYHTAVAYQEMGLMEEAIREFQSAAGLVSPGDGTRRFFYCANLLGHCFMQKGMPGLAVRWYNRALETPGLSVEEKMGIWYELAGAHEAEGDAANAGVFLEQVYAENINFRDVSARIRKLSVDCS